MSIKTDGGPAYPAFLSGHTATDCVSFISTGGMTLRDYFAVTMQYDRELMEDISRCDDQDLLERFGTDAEKDEYFDFVLPEMPMPFKNIELRAKLESRARAAIRYIEADAMLAERAKE